MIIQGPNKNLIATVVTASTGLPFITGTVYAVIQMESTDGDDGFFWDFSGSWLATPTAWPTGSHIKAGMWKYPLTASAFTGSTKVGASIHYVFIDDLGIDNENSASVVSSNGEHIIREAIPTNASISASVWDAALSDHQTASSTGKALSDASGTLDDVADAVWDEVLTSGAHNVVNSSGRLLREIKTGYIIHDGTAQGATSYSITLAAAASSIDEFYEQTVVTIIGGTGEGQTRLIYKYTGASKLAQVAPAWKTTPDNTSDYVVLPALGHSETSAEHLLVGYVTAGAASSITLDQNADSNNDFYNDTVIVLHHNGSADAGQARVITDYVGATRVATVTPPWTSVPLTGTQYAITARRSHYFNQMSASIWDADITKHQTVSSAGKYLSDASGSASSLTLAAISASVWNAAITTHQTAGSAGKYLSDASGSASSLTLAAISASVWDALSGSHLSAGSMGLALFSSSFTSSVVFYESEPAEPI